jgi:hypothetical protein
VRATKMRCLPCRHTEDHTVTVSHTHTHKLHTSSIVLGRKDGTKGDHFVGPLFDHIPSLELLARSVGKWCLGVILAALSWNLELNSLFKE